MEHWGEVEWGGITKGFAVSFLHNENVLELMVVTVVQLYEYTQSHQIAHFKCIGYMACELRLIKTVIKTQNTFPWLPTISLAPE